MHKCYLDTTITIEAKLAAVPDKLYGQDIGSSYQRQGLKLGKQFKPVG